MLIRGVRCKGYAEIASGLFPLIKDPQTINRQIEDAPGKSKIIIIIISYDARRSKTSMQLSLHQYTPVLCLFILYMSLL